MPSSKPASPSTCKELSDWLEAAEAELASEIARVQTLVGDVHKKLGLLSEKDVNVAA